MEKRVLVTGGAGFIGSHLVDAYLERGWRVAVVDNLSTGDKRNVNPQAEFFLGDVRDPMDSLESFRPSVVNHHAAQTDVRASVGDPALDAEVNIVASLRLLQKCVETGVKRFIFASSAGTIYGEPVFAPQTEDHPLRPMSPYGCAKLAVEYYLNYFLQVRGLSAVALRYANVYGPRQPSDGESGVVAIFASRLLHGEDVTINGDGRQTRDFVYIEDVVEANMIVSDQPDLAGAFNVGAVVETSINDLYKLICKSVGVSRQASYGPAKAGEQMRSVVGTKRSVWGAGKVDLSSGLEQTLNYLKGRGN